MRGADRKRLAAALGVVGLLAGAGCTMQPEYERPKLVAMPEHYRESVATLDPKLRHALTEWWQNFKSPELVALVEEAHAENHDLKIAVARIAQAQAMAGVNSAPLLPLIQESTQVQREAPKGGYSSPTDPFPSGWDKGETGLFVSYEVDLWGKNRSAAQAALATAQASVFDREVVMVTMTSDVVNTYLDYLQMQDRLRVARDNVTNMKRVLEIVQRRKAVGEGTDLEIAQQRNALAQAEATISPLAQRAEEDLTKLAVLIGRPPSQLKLKGKSLDQLAIPSAMPGLPSDLLLRRPDVRKAEADLLSVNANIGVARAKLLPSFNLTGQLGLGSRDLSAWLSPASAFYIVTASLATTIFDNGATANEIAYQEARWKEMSSAYARAVLNSLRDVETSLASQRLSLDYEKASDDAVRLAREAHKLSQAAFTIGMTDYLRVLETERTLYRSEDQRVQARYQRLLAATTLYKALGGGAVLPDDPIDSLSRESGKKEAGK
jgi:NodT family efflux transporter outer membrane factor (OMF) lipoprotein